MIDKLPLETPTRRALLRFGAGAALVSTLPLPVSAAPEDMAAAIKAVFGDARVNEGRVALELPPIAENGYSVPLSIEIDSPMTASDHVRRIVIFSPRNPVPEIAHFHFTPASGRARVETRIRLAGTQTVSAVAEMNDGALWSGAAETVVTLAACVVL